MATTLERESLGYDIGCNLDAFPILRCLCCLRRASAQMSTMQARLTVCHDSKGKQAKVYEDGNAHETVKSVVQLMGNGGTTYTPPKPAPVFPWKTVTPLASPGALGSVTTPPWVRAIHLANFVVNDATGKPYPRTGTTRAKVDYTYDAYPDVRLWSLYRACQKLAFPPPTTPAKFAPPPSI